MKTPRELLWQKHQAVTPKLDAVRAGVLEARMGALDGRVAGGTPATATSSFAKATEDRGTVALPEGDVCGWRDFVRSVRWHLAGLGVAWAAVVALNLDARSGREAMIAREDVPAAKELWAAVRENRRELAKFFETPVAESAVAPGRRSEARPRQVVV
jgi:hypothetical protein